MDLGIWLRVMWRFKLLLVTGLIVALGLGLISVARVDFGGGTPSVSYRDDEVWVSSATLLVTQPGFPWGRAVLDDMVQVPNPGGTPTLVPRYGNEARYTSLAALYSELAKSDAVQRDVLREAAPNERYDAQVVTNPDGAGALPMIWMSGYAPSPQAAMDTANRATDAFLRYLVRKQAENAIQVEKRVDVTVVKRATEAQVFESRSLVRPVFLMLLVLMIFVGLAFMLENLRPRARPPAPAVVTADYPPRARRSA